jgi:D-threo-aldose 1-dehydrogenase
MTGTVVPQVSLGRNELRVGRFAVGNAPLGALASTPADDETGWAMLEAAWAGGVRTFDVAPLYGRGRAERRLGAFLATKPRDEFVLSTKVGRLLVGESGGSDDSKPVFDFSRDGVRASLDASLIRLGLDRVDIALIHDPDDHGAEAMDTTYPALEDLRSAGVVRAIGLGMNQAEMLERFVRDTDIDCFLVAGRYSLLDDRAAASLLPAALERGIGVLVGGVFNSGILADPSPGSTFNYRPADPELLARAQALRSVAAAHGVSLSRAAMHFSLRHPAVTAIVVGARSPEEIVANLADFSAPVPPELWTDLEGSGLLGWRQPRVAD